MAESKIRLPVEAATLEKGEANSEQENSHNSEGQEVEPREKARKQQEPGAKVQDEYREREARAMLG